MDDYYNVLEVPPSATKEEIKRSYRRLALKYHPDKNQADLEYNKIFVTINKAYNILYNETLRKQYDLKYKSAIAKQIKTVTPKLFLEKIQNIRKFIIGKGRNKISHAALYKSLNNLLTNNNLRYLRVNKEKDINEEIIKEVLKCCNFLSTIEVEKLTKKLLFLAGDDIIIKEHIIKYISRHKTLKYTYFIKDLVIDISKKISKIFS